MVVDKEYRSLNKISLMELTLDDSSDFLLEGIPYTISKSRPPSEMTEYIDDIFALAAKKVSMAKSNQEQPPSRIEAILVSDEVKIE